MMITKYLLLAETTTNEAASTGSDPMLLLAIFALAIFVGVEIITKIPPTLHTPLMSGSNAISGITIVGALLSLQIFSNEDELSIFVKLFGCIAVIMATINVVGGFMVTNRMLGMFRTKKD